jgi:hypothetical protein
MRRRLSVNFSQFAGVNQPSPHLPGQQVLLGRVESHSDTSTVIALDRLPPPLADGRSLGGAIKVFFQKVISQVTGRIFDYPILASAEVAEEGTARSFRDAATTRPRACPAQGV